MEVDFELSDRDQILANIKKAMGGRQLSKMVDFDMQSGEMVVTISKLGKSKLVFSEKTNDKGLTYTLSKEKIAFAHKAFKDDVTDKIIGVIEQAGGTVS